MMCALSLAITKAISRRVIHLSLRMNEFSDEIATILETLKANPRGMSVTDIAQAIGVNRNTVSRYLDTLLISGQAEMKIYGKAKVFFLSQRVPISAMLDFSSEMVIILDRQLFIIQVNDAVGAFTGEEKEAIIGKELRNSPLAAFDHPVIIEKIKEAFGGSEIVEELRFLRVGEELFFHFKIVPTVFNNGSPGVTLILEDITERKRSEEALRQSEMTYRALVEEINDVIWNIDEDGRFSYVSPRIADVLGYEPAELIGRTIYEYMEAEEADRVRSLLPPDGRDGEPYPLAQYMMLHRDGRPVAIEAGATPMHDEIGDFAGFRVVARDISERMQATKRLRQWKSFLGSIVQNIPAKVMVKELANNTFIFFNHSAEVLLGASSAALVGKQEKDLFPPEVAMALQAADVKVKKTGKAVEVPDVRMELPGMGSRILAIKKIPIFNSGEQPTYILGIAKDVTDQKRAEMLLHAQRDLAVSLGTISTLEEALPACLSTALSVSGFESGGVLILQQGEAPHLFSCTEGVTAVRCEEIFRINRSLIEGVVFTRGEPFYARAGDLAGGMGELKTIAFVPVRDGRKVMACIMLGSMVLDEIPSWGSHALETIAAQISQIIARISAQESLKKERDRAQSYFDVAGVMIAVIDADGKISRMNRKGCSVLGYDEADLVGKDWFDMLVPMESREKLRARFGQLMAGKQIPPACEVGTILTSAGEGRIIRWQNALLMGDEGRIAAMVSSGEDITPLPDPASGSLS
jgi:PAS domain S-box-containing protein